MTVHRAAGPGPRNAAPHSALRRGLPGMTPVAIGTLILAILTGCGEASPVTSASPSAGASGSGSGSSLAPGQTPPAWPGTTVLATIAFGAADGEIQKAGVDLAAAVERQDLRAMWGAADGLAKLIDGLTPNIERLESYPVTAAAGAIYRKALPELAAGAKQLRDAITAGDSDSVVAGTLKIQQGLKDYAPVRPLIAALVEQAIVQQRLLVR